MAHTNDQGRAQSGAETTDATDGIFDHWYAMFRGSSSDAMKVWEHTGVDGIKRTNEFHYDGSTVASGPGTIAGDGYASDIVNTRVS